MSDAATLTAEDVRVQVSVLAAAHGLDEEDVESLLLPQALLLATGYREALASREPTPLDQFIVWLNQVAEIMGPLGTIAGAVTSGLGLKL